MFFTVRGLGRLPAKPAEPFFFWCRPESEENGIDAAFFATRVRRMGADRRGRQGPSLVRRFRPQKCALTAESKELTAVQARELHSALFPHVNYLRRLQTALPAG